MYAQLSQHPTTTLQVDVLDFDWTIGLCFCNSYSASNVDDDHFIRWTRLEFAVNSVTAECPQWLPVPIMDLLPPCLTVDMRVLYWSVVVGSSRYLHFGYLENIVAEVLGFAQMQLCADLSLVVLYRLLLEQLYPTRSMKPYLSSLCSLCFK